MLSMVNVSLMLSFVMDCDTFNNQPSAAPRRGRENCAARTGAARIRDSPPCFRPVSRHVSIAFRPNTAPRIGFAPIRGRASGFVCGDHKQAAEAGKQAPVSGGERATPGAALAAGLAAGRRASNARGPARRARGFARRAGANPRLRRFRCAPRWDRETRRACFYPPSARTPRCRGLPGRLLELDISFSLYLSLHISIFICDIYSPSNRIPSRRPVRFLQVI